MKKDKTLPPAVQKAYAFVKNSIEKGVWKQGENLPSTRVLALRSGVSFVTMMRAVAALKSRGLISGIPRRRMRAGNESVIDIPAPDLHNPVWRLKRAALEKDILNGAYGRENHLPSFKELQARYGVCFQTMRKILRSMVADEVLSLRGKTYELIGSIGRPSLRSIVFITYQIQRMPFSALNQGQYRIFDLLEHECIRREINLEIVEIDFYDPAETRRAMTRDPLCASAEGFVLNLWWYTNEKFRLMQSEFLLSLSALKKPIAILDEFGDFILPPRLTANPLIQVFRIEGKKAGSRIGRLLLGMGHRSVAYISSYHDLPWSRQRLEGIADEYSKAGFGRNVHAVTGENIEFGHNHILALSGFDDALVKKIFMVNNPKSQAEEQFQTYKHFKLKLQRQQINRRDMRSIRKKLLIFKDLFHRNLDASTISRTSNTVFEEIGGLVSMNVRAPLFQRALQNPEITAWICATDGVALTALSFLHERGIAVPEKLSIAGFDNTPVKALESRLTSVDFNADGFVHRMLNFIARPPKPRGPYRHAPIEVEGIVMRRDTTAPPRKVD